MFKAIFIVVVTAIVAFAGTMVWALHDLSPSAVLEPGTEPVIVLEAADGTELARQGPVRDPPVARRDIPQHLVDAVIAIEDRRFYDHGGIDLIGIARAFISNVSAGRIVEGGSTITQQLVKLRLGDTERTLRRKLREAVLALWLERRLSKGEILTEYLNTAYFGAGAHGISAAARVYFSKPVSELTLEESVVLAGLITAPSRLNPINDPDAAQERANMVLDAMVESRRLDRLRAQAAKERPASLNRTPVEAPARTWFADWAHQQAAEVARSFEATEASAVRVRTTLDPRLQELAERIVSRALGDNGEMQAALVAMRPDGAVLAMVGGRSYEESQFNRAVQAMRQPGSTFKLFVYFAALRNGFSPDDVIEDRPIEIGRWNPENFGERYHGRVRLADAFARSLNTAAVRLAQEVGIDEVVEAARLLGIDAPLRETPSLALGTSEVSLIDLTGAFASVRAGIAPIEPWAIAAFGMLDQQRLLRPGPPATPRRSLAPYDKPLIEMLQRVVERGTGRAAALDGFAAGKTGTSENYRDAWFIGFTEHLVAGVWVGNDDGSPMDEMTGGKLPARIWREFMAEASGMLDGGPPAADPSGEELLSGTWETGPAEPQRDGNPVVIRPRDPQVYQRGLAPPLPDEPESPEELSRTDPIGEFLESTETEPEAQALCDIDACSSRYRSFRASDCSYQPYGGGPRKLCPIGPPEEANAGTIFDEEANVGTAFQCNYQACSRSYRSFRASDCTFQPYSGPRRRCER